MGPIIAAWLVGEGIICYRQIKATKAPPGPGVLLYSSGLFVLLGILAQAESARKLATALAWGFDIAAAMNLGNLAQVKADNAKWPPTATIPDTQVLPGAPKGQVD